MGMLMHHTWLEQQKEQNKTDSGKQVEEPVKETEPEAPKKCGRRKVTK